MAIHFLLRSKLNDEFPGRDPTLQHGYSVLYFPQAPTNYDGLGNSFERPKSQCFRNIVRPYPFNNFFVVDDVRRIGNYKVTS